VSIGVVKLGMGQQRGFLAGGACPGEPERCWLFSEGPWGRQEAVAPDACKETPIK